MHCETGEKEVGEGGPYFWGEEDGAPGVADVEGGEDVERGGEVLEDEEDEFSREAREEVFGVGGWGNPGCFRERLAAREKK